MPASPPRLRPRAAGIATVLALATVLTGTATAAAPGPPDGRVYERVTPARTAGVPALQTGLQVKVIDDDTLISTSGVSPLGDAPSGVPQTSVMRRTPDGWRSSPFMPANPDALSAYTLLDATPTLSGAVYIQTPSEIFSVPTERAFPARYLWRGADGTTKTIATVSATVGSDLVFGGLSADGRAVSVVSSSDPATGDAARRTVYRWTPDGGLQPLGRAAGDPLETCSADVVGGLYPFDTPPTDGTNGMSADGRTVFVQAYRDPFSGSDGATCPAQIQIFRERVGLPSERVSRPTDAGVPDDPQIASFRAASPDGDTVFFVTAGVLADADDGTGVDLYRWRAGAGSAGPTVDCVSCAVPGDVTGVTPSRTAGVVYFRSGADLFVLHDGRVDRVDAVDPPSNNDGRSGRQALAAVSADGRHPVYQRDGALYTTTVGPAGVGSVECVSCRADGTPGPADIAARGLGQLGSMSTARGASGLSGQYDGGVSEDGRTVAFVSTEALAPDVTDGIPTAYRWKQGSGLAVVATDVSPVGGATVSPSGNTVFFASYASLTGDADAPGSALRIFGARIGGGFPAPPASPQPCAGDACRGPGAPGPAPPPPGSTAPARVGNAAPPKDVPSAKPTLRIGSVSRATRATSARSGRLRLRVTARGAGTIRARSTARIGGATRTVARATATGTQRTATRSLSLRLSAAARAELRRTGRLRITTTVTLSGATKRSITVTLTRKRG